MTRAPQRRGAQCSCIGCIGLRLALFQTVLNYAWLTAINFELCLAYCYQQCHCLAALPAKMSAFICLMQGSHSVISNKSRLATKKTYSYNKTQKTCVTNKNIRVCLFELKRQSNTDLFAVPLPNFHLQFKHLHLDDLFLLSRRFS